jgi:hypothetical protein
MSIEVGWPKNNIFAENISKWNGRIGFLIAPGRGFAITGTT